MPAQWHLAQVNIGRARGAITDPVMQGFVARLEEINALAERTPGFVWRLQTEDGNATAFRPYPMTTASSSICRSGPISMHCESMFSEVCTRR